MNETSRATLGLFRTGLSVAQIAEKRGFAVSTIYGHLCNAIDAGETVPIERLTTPDQRTAIDSTVSEFGGNIRGAIERLGEGYDYGLVKAYLAAMRQPV